MKKTGIKKILAIILAVVLSLGAVAGIVVAVRKTTGGNGILVVEAGNFNYGGWYGDMNMMEGIVMSDASQDVYIAETDTIAEVLVAEGDTVSEGQLLIRFDQTKTGLALERQQLAYDKLVLSVDVAEQNVATLARMRPYVDPIYIDPVIPDDEGEEEKEPTQADIYGEQAAKDILNSTEDAYNAVDADGSAYFPFRFLCKDGTKISDAFLKSLGDLSYVLEKRAGDMLSGDLTGSYYMSPAALADLGSGWTGTLNFSDHDKPALIIDKPEEPEEDSELEEAKKKIEELEEAAKKDQETISGLEKEIENLNAEIEDLKKQLEEATQGDGSDDSARIAELEQQLADKEAELALKNAEIEQKDAALAEKDTKIAELEERIAELEAQIGELNTTIDQLNERIRELEGNGNTGVSYTPSEGAAHIFGMRFLTPVRRAGSPAVRRQYADGADLFSQSGLISPATQYTKEELEAAREDAAETLRDLQLDLKEAALHLQTAKEADDAGEIHAKMNGVVKKLGDPANPVGDGTPFLSVAGSAGQYIQAGLSELLLDTVHPGDAVSVMSWETGMTYEGTVSEVQPYPDTTGMFGGYGEQAQATYYPLTVYVEGGEGLAPGYWVQLTIQGSGSEEMTDDGFYLYKAFILEQGGHKYVFKRGEDGLLHKTEIRTGALMGSGYRIISGVSEDDWIAFPYGKGVKEGAKTREGTPDELYRM